MKSTFSLLILLLTLSCVSVLAQVSTVPSLMNFQGRLARPDGTPVANGSYSLLFSLYDTKTGGALKWSETDTVTVRNGVFAVLLGNTTPLTDTAFSGNLWLEIKVGSDPALLPRQQIVSVAYAFKADTVPDGSITASKIAANTLTPNLFAPNALNSLAWLLGGDSGTDPATNFLGTTDNQPLVIKVNNRRALQMAYAKKIYDAANGFYDEGTNILGGYSGNSVTAGVVAGTIAGGGLFESNGNVAQPNRVTDVGATIGGGTNNQAGNDNADVYDAFYATIGGGQSNVASERYATIGGGSQNVVSNFFSTVGGGFGNQVSGDHATIGGGNGNTATGNASSVGGGVLNTSGGPGSTVSGGGSNTTMNDFSTISGGFGNTTSGLYATIGGGTDNDAAMDYATVGGGAGNTASQSHATVSGGNTNVAGGPYATVGGGNSNSANVSYATVPGGYSNQAQGDYSFAAGAGAKANTTGTFVWADPIGSDFVSTGSNQFLIRATGGVGIGTAAPSATLHIATTGQQVVQVSSSNTMGTWLNLLNSSTGGKNWNLISTGSGNGELAGQLLFRNGTGQFVVMTLQGGTGNVGIGTTTPGYKLDVNGNLHCIGLSNTSDARYKTNIASLPNALDAVRNLRGVTFDWRRDAYPAMNFGGGRQIGFIAQEVEKVLPELVSTDSSGYKSVAYAELAPVLVEAIKQQQTQIEALRADNAAFRKQAAENARLRSQLATILTRLEQVEQAEKSLRNDAGSR